MFRFKILLVDDDLAFLNGMQRALSEEFEVAVAPSGAEAIRKVKKENWDSVIIDIDMPVMNGYELLEQLKIISADGCYIFLTCLTDDPTYLKSLRLDPDDFLTKPVSAEKLAATVKFRLQKQLPPETFTFQRLRFSLDRGVVNIGTEAVELTKKEQIILLALMRSPEKKVSRDLLTQSIWGEVSVTHHTLDTHLTNLRKKIAAAGVNVYIDRHRFVCLSET